MNDHGHPLSRRLISIRTPENIELSYALAGPGSRATAYVIDFLIMSVICQFLINLFAMAFARNHGGRGREWSVVGRRDRDAGFVRTLQRLLHLPGMALERPDAGQAAAAHPRDQAGRLLAPLPRYVACGTCCASSISCRSSTAWGSTSILLTRDSQRLGDLVAGTLVVYQEPVETESLLPDLPEADESELALPAVQVAAIPDEAIALVAQYLVARNEMAPRARQEVAAELVNLLRDLSGLEPRPAQGVENFLASVVRQAEPAPPSSFQTAAQAEFPS